MPVFFCGHYRAQQPEVERPLSAYRHPNAQRCPKQCRAVRAAMLHRKPPGQRCQSQGRGRVGARPPTASLGSGGQAGWWPFSSWKAGGRQFCRPWHGMLQRLAQSCLLLLPPTIRHGQRREEVLATQCGGVEGESRRLRPEGKQQKKADTRVAVCHSHCCSGRR